MIRKTNITVSPDPSRVILNNLGLTTDDRILSLIKKVMTLEENEVDDILRATEKEFLHRHDIKEFHTDHPEADGSYYQESIFKNYKLLEKHLDGYSTISENRKLLLGAYFTKEYTIEAAALFNPSIVAHPDQSGVEEGSLRFIISLRATGEGHISSIEFRTGILSANGDVALDEPSPFALTPERAKTAYTREFIESRLPDSAKNKAGLPAHFTNQELADFLEEAGLASDLKTSIKQVVDTNYDLKFNHTGPLSERVIFPGAKSEAMGMEDIRFIAFNNESTRRYYGTYTAYDGFNISSQLVETDDFKNFKIRKFYGPAIHDKGMGIFPRKVNGKYAVIGRQGGEAMSLMYSDDLYFWNSYQLLDVPLKHWMFTQIGNCGSPIETEHGWLLIIHGVGPIRKYSIGACLLDLEDPSRVIGCLEEPLLQADESERDGYVPNVVYSCGSMVHHGKLILPYAKSDVSSGFAIVNMDELLNKLLSPIS